MCVCVCVCVCVCYCDLLWMKQFYYHSIFFNVFNKIMASKQLFAKYNS